MGGPAAPRPTPTPTSSPNTEWPTISYVFSGTITTEVINATKVGDEYLAEKLFVDIGTLEEYYASVFIWLPPVAFSTATSPPTTLQANITIPDIGSNLFSICTLYPQNVVDQNDPSACQPGQLHACHKSVRVSGRAVNPANGGSLRFTAEMGAPFQCEFRLKSALTTPGTDDRLLFTPTVFPTWQPLGLGSDVSLTTTNISVWFFIVLTFVFLCLWRVYRQHRINLLMVGGHVTRRNDEVEEECVVSTGLRGRSAVSLSPIHVLASAEVRIVRAGEPSEHFDGPGQSGGEGEPPRTIATATAVELEPGHFPTRRL